MKLAGVEGGLENNVFTGFARVFNGEQSLLDFLDNTPEELANNDMIIVRFEGPVGGPGMPEMLDSTSRITAICRERDIIVGLMTDGRFSGGSVGLVIGHVGPEAAIGGPIALVENGDTIEVNLNKNEVSCKELASTALWEKRTQEWKNTLDPESKLHPSLGLADTRLLNRMRQSAVSAVYGAGMHPNREIWVPDPRDPVLSDFLPKNKHKQ